MASKGSSDETVYEAAINLEIWRYLEDEIEPAQDHERLALSLEYPRAAAILYDRIWAGVAAWEREAPAEILFGGGEVVAEAMFAQPAEVAGRTSRGEQESHFFWRMLAKRDRRQDSQLFQLSKTVGALGATTADSDLKLDASEVAMMALTGLPFIDEATLSWDQVLEIRSDTLARADLRRFLRWVDSVDLLSEQQEVVEEEYEAFREALKKHGAGVTVTATELLLGFVRPAGEAILIEGAAEKLFGNLVTPSQLITCVAGWAGAGVGVEVWNRRLQLREEQRAIMRMHEHLLFLARLDSDERIRKNAISLRT